jgi:light-regulated signal transduction histidine kinase (bacteriophytochrome)
VERTHDLQVANRELESFAYSVSHDLRAPLRAIEGFSRLIESEYAAKLDERGKDYFRRVRGGATRMGVLIDDILKLSKISRQEMHRETVDLSALAREAAEDLHGAEPGRAVEWKIAPQVSVQGDPGLLRVVVQNLIGNAWKYSSTRASTSIEFGVGEWNGRIACFVRDNGVGFDMAYADKLFGAFQRLHSPREFPGTGIGLATVKRIVHRHGGTVGAEGKDNEGATFYFTL